MDASKNMTNAVLYKVIFLNHGKVYELYAGGVTSSGLYGFIEISDLQFSEEGVLIDPAEDRIREEFSESEVLHLPMHSVVRIEQVKKRGQCKIRDRESGEKVTPFPLMGQRKTDN